MIGPQAMTEPPETLTDSCDRCGKTATFRFPDDPAKHDPWVLGPDNWRVVLVDWDGYLASWSEDGRTYGQDLVVLHVCPACVTDEDLDSPHSSWRMASG